MIKGVEGRTKKLIEYMKRHIRSTKGNKELIIRIQAGFSSVSNIGYTSPENDKVRRYGELLKKERDLLINLLEQGAHLQAIISPPIGPWGNNRLLRRYKALLDFLKKRRDLWQRIDFVYSLEEGPNLFFVGEEVLFEGHKTGIEFGYGWTMVYTEKRYLNTRLTIFDMLFESARRHTLKRYSREGRGEEGKNALRKAVVRAVELARDGENRLAIKKFRASSLLAILATVQQTISNFLLTEKLELVHPFVLLC